MAARALAAQASDAFEQRDFERALSLYDRASAIIAAPTITLMQARTLVELGRLVEAAEKYAETQRMLSLDPSNSAFRDATDAARQEVAALMREIPTLRVRLVGPRPDDLVITIDGRRLLPALAAVAHPVNPGVHRVEARTRHGVVVHEVTLAERQHEDVVLELPRAAAAPLPRPVLVAGTPPRAFEAGSAQRTFGWVLAGTGAGLATLGAVTGFMALGRKSELDDVCRPGCPETSRSDIDAYRLERTLSYVGFGIGTAALAGGAILLWQAPARTDVAVGVGPRAFSVAGRFQ